MPPGFVARLICSDPDCAAEVSAEARTLAELETLACECGCGFAVVAFPDWVDPAEASAEVVVLRPVGRVAGLPDAA